MYIIASAVDSSLGKEMREVTWMQIKIFELENDNFFTCMIQ